MARGVRDIFVPNKEAKRTQAVRNKEETPKVFLCREEAPKVFLCREETPKVFLCKEETPKVFFTPSAQRWHFWK